MGEKKVRGESYLRPGEPSKLNLNLYLSRKAIQKLEKIATIAKQSKSEFVESWIRSLPEYDEKNSN
jgi:hypothetical protein